MQLARLVDMRSVGEKASPLPWLSLGASLWMTVLESRWTASVRSSPLYVTLIWCITILGQGTDAGMAVVPGE
ncbi:MAG TPA: hypothetical protein VNJ01_04940 [Bacteriovoracaceae bacterium]|nr:hypothetical protein [Bacteriovoracaceae bacterium]